MPRKSSRTQTPSEGYGFSEVVELTTATRSNLIHWTNIGIIKPGIGDTAGPGYPRRFSLWNLAEVELCAAVNRFRVPVTLVGQALEALRQFHRRKVAVSDNGPLTGPELTQQQANALAEALRLEFLERDERLGMSSPRDRYRSVVAETMASGGPTDITRAVADAAAWMRFRSDRAFREERFCAAVVTPVVPTYAKGEVLTEHANVIADWERVIDLNWAVSWEAIVINLGTIFNRVEMSTGKKLS